MKRSIILLLIASLALLTTSAHGTPLTEVQKLLAEDGASTDIFGQSVAIDGDMVVIGARFDDDNGTDSGSAYLYVRSSGVWSQQAKLLPSNGAAFDHYGQSVAVGGNIAVIGANRHNIQAGAAYVFDLTGASGIVNEVAKLLPSDSHSVQGFGWSAAISGSSAVVGAVFADDNGTSSGSAYVFDLTGASGIVNEVAKLLPSDGATNDQFGFSVTVNGNTAVVGAHFDDDNGSSSGSAYVFDLTGASGIVNEVAKLLPSDGATSDQFGDTVSVSSNKAVIGAYRDDDNGTSSGSAYVFDLTGASGIVNEVAKLLPSDGAAVDLFGNSVAADSNKVVIGANLDFHDNGRRSGSAYVFDLTGASGIVNEVAKLLPSDGARGDNFGEAVALSGGTAVIGSWADDDNGNGSGSAYVFLLGIDPVADAGPDQTEDEGLLVTLDGSASSNATNYNWTQVAGPTVSLSSTTVVNPDFTAPYVTTNTTLNFQLIVDDGQGNVSDPDTVNITVVSVNNPPVADAGDDGSIKEGAVATLDGSNSFDPEGDTPLGFTWTQTTGPLVSLVPSNTVVNPSFTAPLGVGNVLTFELVVDDGKEFSTSDAVVITVVENSQPVANAGPDQTVDEGSPVNLDGTASNDPDGGDTITFDWSEPVTLNDDTSPTPSFTAPLASPGGEVLTFDLIVTDDDPINPKSSNPDQVVINVRNINDPPSCDLAQAVCPDSKIKGNNGCMLWPPNHKLIAVNIDGVMDADAQYNDVTLQITGVTQDEPVNGGGDGDTSPDAIIQAGSPADTVLIRAERTGLGGAQENGRVYVVSFTASDGFESCTGSVTIGVPHDRKDTPVDDGQTIDSTQP